MDLVIQIIGITGAVAGIVSLYLALPGLRTWRSVTKGVRKIVKLLRRQEFKPEIIVCLGRGGCVFGGLLAGNIGIVPIIGIDREVISEGKDKKVELIHTEALSKLKGKKVLLVSGEVVTGTDLRTARKELEKQTGDTALVRTASYTVCKSTAEYPDFYVKETRSPTNAPWRLLASYIRPNKPGMID